MLIVNSLGIVPMLMTIDLDDKFRCEAAKVRYISPNWNLTAKVPFLKGQTLPQMPPEFSLRFREVPTQRTRTIPLPL